MEKLSEDIKMILSDFSYASKHLMWLAIAPTLFLQKDKDERLAFLNAEARSMIQRIRSNHGGIVFKMIQMNGLDNSEITSYTVFYMSELESFAELSRTEVEKYQSVFNKLKEESTAFSEREEKMFWITKQDEIMKLPKAKSIVDAIGLFYHLDHINRNKDAVLRGKPMIDLPSDDLGTTTYIKDCLIAINTEKGYSYAFESLENFNFFSELLARFLDGEEYQIPEIVIPLKRRTKTQIASTLGDIYAEKSKKNMRSDKDFYKILRILSEFHELTDKEIYEKARK